jgi:hydrogenase-4 membrane subunit HyfE
LINAFAAITTTIAITLRKSAVIASGLSFLILHGYAVKYFTAAAEKNTKKNTETEDNSSSFESNQKQISLLFHRLIC